MNFKCCGQATVEYLFILIFISFIGVQMVKGFSRFLGNSMGNLAHVMSANLTTGVCATDCYFSNYKNGLSE